MLQMKAERLISESLADMIMEDFRSSPNPSDKMEMICQIKSLAYPGPTVFEDFNADVSHTAVATALMVRKFDTREFESILKKSFTACIDALTDNQGWNDSSTIRFMAKVIACIPGVGQDARIALACQFYYLDPAFKPKHAASGTGEGIAESPDKGEEQGSEIWDLDAGKPQSCLHATSRDS